MTWPDMLGVVQVFAGLVAVLLVGSIVRYAVDRVRWRMLHRPRPARRFR
jgi:hypothetical protein